MVTNYEGENIEFKEVLPLLPIRDLVVYPFMIHPLVVSRESSIQAVEEAMNNTDRLIFLSSQKDIHAEMPKPDEIFNLGTVATIIRKRNRPGGGIKILIQGLAKARIAGFEQSKPWFQVKLQKIEAVEVKESQEVVEALLRSVKENLEKVINKSKVLSSDILMILEDIHNPSRFADLVSSNLNLKVQQAQEVLEILNPIERLNRLNDILLSEIKILEYQEQIKSTTTSEISKTQKEYFLREQIKQMKSELGDNPTQDEFSELKNKVINKKMPEEVEFEVLKQMGRLEKMHHGRRNLKK